MGKKHSESRPITKEKVKTYPTVKVVGVGDSKDPADAGTSDREEAR